VAQPIKNEMMLNQKELIKRKEIIDKIFNNQNMDLNKIIELLRLEFENKGKSNRKLKPTKVCSKRVN
jgi:hypothetical protein